MLRELSGRSGRRLMLAHATPLLCTRRAEERARETAPAAARAAMRLRSLLYRGGMRRVRGLLPSVSSSEFLLLIPLRHLHMHPSPLARPLPSLNPRVLCTACM